MQAQCQFARAKGMDEEEITFIGYIVCFLGDENALGLDRCHRCTSL